MKRILIIISIIIVIGAIGFWQLGGFNHPEITLQKDQEYTILGDYYEGRYKTREAEELFVKTRNSILDSTTVLTIVNYQHDTLVEKEKVYYFMGILYQERFQKPEIPGFTQKKFRESQVVRLRFQRHNMTMPRPHKVLELAEEFAQSRGLRVGDYSIEKYISETQYEIDFPLIGESGQ